MTELIDDKLTPDNLGGLRVARVKDRPKTVNILVYGESGAGKTQLGGSADDVPEMRPVLVVDIEGGTLTLAHTYPEAEVVRVETWDDMQKLYDELLRGNHGYRTVVLDSLTEIQKFSMYQIMKDLTEKEPDRDPDIPGMREWGKSIEQMRRFVRAFRDLPMNAIFTALSTTSKDPKTGTVTTRPALPGKLSSEVAAFLDIVAYLYVKNIRDGDTVKNSRLLLTGTTGNQVAKDRSGSLPLVMEEPTMRDIYEYAISGKAEAK